MAWSKVSVILLDIEISFQPSEQDIRVCILGCQKLLFTYEYSNFSTVDAYVDIHFQG
jgi:hypothetical protein